MRWLILALAAGCGTPAPSAPPPAHRPVPPAPPGPSALPTPPTPPTPPSPFPVAPGQEPFRTVRSQRFQLSFPLPDRSGWALDKDGSSFLVMHHPATDSTLLIRRWLEQFPTNRDGCEEAARLIRDLPERVGAIGSTYLDVPPGFDTRVDWGIAEVGPSKRAGWLLAFGARARRCFAFVYTSESAPPEAERVLADRLVVMQTLVLEELVVHRDTEPELGPIRP